MVKRKNQRKGHEGCRPSTLQGEDYLSLLKGFIDVIVLHNAFCALSA